MSRNFILVVIGQIISLFGNQILRFALPLYLLNQTGSPAIFGMISACSFLPMIVLCPVGGIMADRVNKRNIMVILDFTTALVVLLLTILLGKVNVVFLLLIGLIMLYGIQGTYQPAVQASIPALVRPEQMMSANAIINLVSSLAGLIGPVLGGALFAFYGIQPILYLSIVCFTISAIMEMFIRIPFQPTQTQGSIFAVGFGDLKESMHFIRVDKPQIWKVSFIIAGINLFLSAGVIIGLPIAITKSLQFDSITANQLYGYAEGAVAAGSLMGGLLAGVMKKRLDIQKSYILLLWSALTLVPIGLALQFVITPMISYWVMMGSCVIMMALAALFSIQMMVQLQIMTPEHMVGKVISCAMCIGMCASPFGQAFYGNFFEYCSSKPYLPFYFGALSTGIIGITSKKIFMEIATGE